VSSREAIFANVRAGLGVRGTEPSRRATVEQRLTRPGRNLVPERAREKAQDELAAMLRRALEEQTATVVEARSVDDLPALIGSYLRSLNLPAWVRIGADSLLNGVVWGNEPTLRVDTGPAQPSDEVGLTHALAGIAETGTLMLASGPENPVTLNFLPETSIVVLARGDIVGPYEDAWDRFRARFGSRMLPRTVNLISGPSCTADIGSTIVRGAHGPRRLCVIIVGEPHGAE